MTTVRDIENALFAWAPKELAEEWDNVGLLVGDGTAPVHKVLVALDITEAVAEEAAALGAELIVSHHPVIFPLAGPLCRLPPDERFCLRRCTAHRCSLTILPQVVRTLQGVFHNLGCRTGRFFPH